MKAKVAVATVQGKAYFLIVCELKQRKIPFLSLVPGDAIPAEVTAVITTNEEKALIKHDKVLVYDPKAEPEIMGREVVLLLHGKKQYETIVIGVDPGEDFGVAVLADEELIDTDNCFSVKETLDKIKGVLRTVDSSRSSVTVKIGSGVPVYKEVLEALDEVLPAQVHFEIVSEAGTNHYGREEKHRRGFRHITSAMRIAGRTGYLYQRRKTIEQNH